MISLLDKKIRRITYNILNLPKAVDMMNPSTGRLALEYGHYISYGYRADGAKIGKVLNYSSEYVGGSYSEKWDYLDGFQYRFFKYLGTREEPILEIDLETGQTIKKTKGEFVLQFFPTSEGYYDYLHKRYVYHYTDHLGNVRLSYYKGSNNLVIDKESNYYPFGLEHTGYNGLLGNQSYSYKYNSKELQTEIGMYDYGARFYMPDLGRWGVVDGLSEGRPNMSPYRFSFNNPVNSIDATGLWEDWVYNYDRNEIYWNDNATSQATAGVNETYLGKSGTYTAEDGSTTALYSDRSHVNNSLLGGLGIMNNLDPLIQAGENGPYQSILAFGTSGDGSYIRETPSLNSLEGAMSSPSGQLAVAGLYGLQGGLMGIGAELVLSKIGLATKPSLSTIGSIAGDGLGSLGVQTSFSSGGVSMGQAIEMVPSNFSYIGGLNKGDGFKFADPATRGSNQILIEFGNPASRDVLHRGPYIKVNQGGSYIERVPLQGNPVLNIGR